MSETIYIETSIFGYLTARPSENLIIEANMKVTQDWWTERRDSFILYASEIVQDEAARGDKAIAEQRLNLLRSLRFLNLTKKAIPDWCRAWL